jgi:acetyl esterase/lipase
VIYTVWISLNAGYDRGLHDHEIGAREPNPVRPFSGKAEEIRPVGAQDRVKKAGVRTVLVRLSTGATHVDVYLPETTDRAPLVIVAHGFWRKRHFMSGWGWHLAKEGFVAAVPDLPAWSDHARNGRFVSELRAYLCANDAWSSVIDSSHMGLMGFSAGGLATLLSAPDHPKPAIWIGLDPVDRKGMGAKAAPGVECTAVVVTAEPSACNGHGNAQRIVDALPRCRHVSVAGAVHVDAEWPTDWKAEAICGRSREERRGEFRRHATEALHEALRMSPASDPAATGPRSALPPNDAAGAITGREQRFREEGPLGQNGR